MVFNFNGTKWYFMGSLCEVAVATIQIRSYFFGSVSGSGLENSDPDPTYIGRGIYSGKFAELGKGGKISL